MARGCPACGSTSVETYRHPYAQIKCESCGFILRDEGRAEMNVPPKEKVAETKMKCFSTISADVPLEDAFNYFFKGKDVEIIETKLFNKEAVIVIYREVSVLRKHD